MRLPGEGAVDEEETPQHGERMQKVESESVEEMQYQHTQCIRTKHALTSSKDGDATSVSLAVV